MQASTLVTSTVALAIVACSSVEGGPGKPAADEATSQDALTQGTSCDTETQPTYSGGQRTGDVEVIRIDGKKITIPTGNAFLKLRELAQEKGIDLVLNSGFRTMAEQEHLYQCYQTGGCNNGNLAARPGYSNHQSGRALDIGTGQRAALNRLIRENGLDWRLTVPSEAWHYEYFGERVSGPLRRPKWRDRAGASRDDASSSPTNTGLAAATRAAAGSAASRDRRARSLAGAARGAVLLADVAAPSGRPRLRAGAVDAPLLPVHERLLVSGQRR
ncbi:MAG: D-alanyl-D-alanine carboxypeptidase family protein [Myxococcales bacterium]|nr:D-alanyl-D-alanine carboxypeptidase family protein [Myxococcales bacterium]